MSATDFTEKQRLYRMHMAAVPAALAAARDACNALDGSPLNDAENPRCCLSCGQLRTVVAEVERLTTKVQQLQKDMREEQREFQREARDIAAEATWQERGRSEQGGY